MNEKLQLVEDLWDNRSASPEVVPVHEWHKEELDRRKEKLAGNPDSGIEWEDAKRRICRLKKF